jgi:hypothetical protein
MKFAPTFSYKKSIGMDYICMTIYKDNGKVSEYKYIYNNYEFAIMYFDLIKKHNYNTSTILTVWNDWWNNGKLDSLKYDLSFIHIS